jgi:hypothetical protein
MVLASPKGSAWKRRSRKAHRRMRQRRESVSALQKALPRRCLFALAVVLGLGIVGPATATAASFSFKETFGSLAQPTFSQPTALALEPESGDLLIPDAQLGIISQFKTTGEPDPFTALADNVLDGSETPEGHLEINGNPRVVQVAVDDSGGVANGDIYVTQFSDHLVDVFAADGTYLGQLTASGEGPFGLVAGVAVDSTGAVYVSQLDGSEGRIDKFIPAANPPTNADNVQIFNRLGVGHLAAGSMLTSGAIFAANTTSGISKLDSENGKEQYLVSNSESAALAVDSSTGKVLSATINEVSEFDASSSMAAARIGGFSPGSNITGIAVDPTSGDVYISRQDVPTIAVWRPSFVPGVETDAAMPVGTSSATLRGSVNPNGLPLAECFFEYGETTQYGSVAPCEAPSAAEVGSGTTPVPVHANVQLEGGTKYHFRLVATNAENQPGEPTRGGDEELSTAGPQVRNESVTQVTATSVRVSAEINPIGEAASFFVEYATEAQFAASGFASAQRAPVPARAIGSGTVPAGVIQQLSGLEPRTNYHYRVVAESSSGTTLGRDQTFTTYPPAGSLLPDSRSYEMVSPPQKSGEVITPGPNSGLGGSCGACLPGESKPQMPMQSAPNGESVLYEGQPFSAGLAAGLNEYISTRSQVGWGLRTLSSSSTTGVWQAFSPDLSRGVLYQVNPPPSPEAPTRGGEAFANLYLTEAAGTVQALITEEPPNREPGEQGAGGHPFRIRYGGANSGTALVPAFSHVVFEANDALTNSVPAVAPPAPEVKPNIECAEHSECDLYEWNAGRVRLVNVLPGNDVAASKAVIGSGRIENLTLGYEAPNVTNAISADGRFVFWSTEETGESYVRVDGVTTLALPGPGTCKESEPVAARTCFLTASRDGKRALLSDGQLLELNESATAYEPTYDLSQGNGGFQGILGAAGDLSVVYFVDTAVLTSRGEHNLNGEHAEAGAPNLYVWAGGATHFIGRLLPSDDQIGTQTHFGVWKASISDRTAQVSTDGGYLAFMSRASLTGYDNARAGGGECVQGAGPSCLEVFEYDASTGVLSCVSCNPAGERPLGGSSLSLLNPKNGAPAFPQPSNLSVDGRGRLFFQSLDALSAQDTNGGVQDVYEWEPDGVGSCIRAGGCVSLISAGDDASDSTFLDSTPSGDDAFFITRDQLSPRDSDQQLDLYDARVGGGFAEESVPTCTGEACKGPLSTPPDLPGAGTGSLVGVANPKPAQGCKRGFHKKKGKCVKKKQNGKRHNHARHHRGGSK